MTRRETWLPFIHAAIATLLLLGGVLFLAVSAFLPNNALPAAGGAALWAGLLVFAALPPAPRRLALLALAFGGAAVWTVVFIGAPVPSALATAFFLAPLLFFVASMGDVVLASRLFFTPPAWYMVAALEAAFVIAWLLPVGLSIGASLPLALAIIAVLLAYRGFIAQEAPPPVPRAPSGAWSLSAALAPAVPGTLFLAFAGNALMHGAAPAALLASVVVVPLTLLASYAFLIGWSRAR